MEKFWRHLWMLCTVVLLGFGTEDGYCLKNVSLLVVPPTVQLGSHASLFCQYDLEGAPLYSVKWYRGSYEFYRYSPGEKPATKIFPYRGFHVDLSVSNESVAVLRKVGFSLSGNFSCEVTVEAPSFSTATDRQHMLVVALPDGPPVIHTEHDRYEPGDTLRANCTSPPSKPPASLSFFLNNIPVGDPEIRQYTSMPDTRQASYLSLSTTLFPIHFTNGQLVLKCTAHVTTLYRKTTEAHLSTRTREPVPERVSDLRPKKWFVWTSTHSPTTVTSQNASAPRLTTPLHLILLILGCHIAR